MGFFWILFPELVFYYKIFLFPQAEVNSLNTLPNQTPSHKKKKNISFSPSASTLLAHMEIGFWGKSSPARLSQHPQASFFAGDGVLALLVPSIVASLNLKNLSLSHLNRICVYSFSRALLSGAELL